MKKTAKPVRLKRLKPYQRVILEDLVKAQRPLSTRQVSQRLNISWDAAKNNLKKLKDTGLVIVPRSSSRKTAWTYDGWKPRQPSF